MAGAPAPGPLRRLLFKQSSVLTWSSAADLTLAASRESSVGDTSCLPRPYHPPLRLTNPQWTGFGPVLPLPAMDPKTPVDPGSQRLPHPEGRPRRSRESRARARARPGGRAGFERGTHLDHVRMAISAVRAVVSAESEGVKPAATCYAPRHGSRGDGACPCSARERFPRPNRPPLVRPTPCWPAARAAGHTVRTARRAASGVLDQCAAASAAGGPGHSGK